MNRNIPYEWQYYNRPKPRNAVERERAGYKARLEAEISKLQKELNQINKQENER